MPQDTGRKLNEYKTYSRPPGCLLNVLCTFNLRPCPEVITKKIYLFLIQLDILIFMQSLLGYLQKIHPEKYPKSIQLYNFLKKRNMS